MGCGTRYIVWPTKVAFDAHVAELNLQMTEPMLLWKLKRGSGGCFSGVCLFGVFVAFPSAISGGIFGVFVLFRLSAYAIWDLT